MRRGVFRIQQIIQTISPDVFTCPYFNLKLNDRSIRLQIFNHTFHVFFFMFPFYKFFTPIFSKQSAEDSQKQHEEFKKEMPEIFSGCLVQMLSVSFHVLLFITVW